MAYLSTPSCHVELCAHFETARKKSVTAAKPAAPGSDRGVYMLTARGQQQSMVRRQSPQPVSSSAEHIARQRAEPPDRENFADDS
ncbi:hypothetical protein MTO96_022139 [Rhipicephalus appendiculatus]